MKRKAKSSQKELMMKMIREDTSGHEDNIVINGN